MRLELLVLLSIMLLAGCTQESISDVLDSVGGALDSANVGGLPSVCFSLESANFNINEVNLILSLTNSPLSSAYPEPGTVDFPVNRIIALIFNDDETLSDYAYGLYEKETLLKVYIDTTTFDMYAGDFGLKPLVNGELVALRPNTEYVVELININTLEGYYFTFTTGDVDLVQPFVESVSKLGSNLEITFSERVVMGSINAESVMISCGEPDYANIGTSASSSFEDRIVYVPVELVDGCNISIISVRDLAGNEMGHGALYTYSDGLFTPSNYNEVIDYSYDYQSYDSYYLLPEVCYETHEPEVNDTVSNNTCTLEMKAAEICTLDYSPVCGDDGVTYGNVCSACASGDIDSWVNGECDGGVVEPPVVNDTVINDTTPEVNDSVPVTTDLVFDGELLLNLGVEVIKDLTNDADNVYFHTCVWEGTLGQYQEQIMRLYSYNKSNGVATELFEMNVDLCDDTILSDDGYLYMIASNDLGNNEIWKIDKSSGVLTKLLSQPNGISNLAIDANYTYYLERTGSYLDDYYVMRLPKDGGIAQSVIQLVGGVFTIPDFAVDSNYLYYSFASGFGLEGVNRTDKDGFNPMIVASVGKNLLTVGDGYVLQLKIANDPTLYVDNSAVAVSDVYNYFRDVYFYNNAVYYSAQATSSVAGALFKYSLTGGSSSTFVTSLASSYSGAMKATFDSTHIYYKDSFSNNTSGETNFYLARKEL